MCSPRTFPERTVRRRGRPSKPLPARGRRCCRNSSALQLLYELLRVPEDGEYRHRQRDVGKHGHRFSVRDEPVRSIGDRLLVPASNLVSTIRPGKKLSAANAESAVANTFFTCRRSIFVCQKGLRTIRASVIPESSVCC